NPGGAQGVLHRRLVAAEERGSLGGAGNVAGLAYACGREDVRLDRGFDTVDLRSALEPADLLEQGGLVAHRADLLVMRETVPQVLAQRVLRALADADDRGAGVREPAHELALVRGEARLHENDVHRRLPDPRCALRM